MSRNPLHAQPLVNAAIYTAAAHGDLLNDPAVVVRALAPVVEEIERSAQEQFDAVQAQLEAERAEWQRERAVLVKLRDRDEADAAIVAGVKQTGPLNNPIGYFVYYLWAGDGSLLYIGMSTNILGRLGEHLNDGFRRSHIRRITTKRCPNEAVMRREEMRAIREHRPPWNVMGIAA